MKTVVLDDDPTGTQSASNVRVLLDWNADLLTDALRDADSVYVQTNSRAIDQASAVARVTDIRNDALTAAARLGEEVQFVLRGDSTLRGHVFAETDVFLADDAVMVFVPAFPDGGRTTVGGMHWVNVAGKNTPAHQTEYADDPVFGFTTGHLEMYTREKSGKRPVSVPLQTVRSDPGALAKAIATAPGGAVVVPDAETNTDIRTIAAAVGDARAQGRPVVVRCAAPLAAALANVESDRLLPRPLVPTPMPTLLVCGSHTTGATAQLSRVTDAWGPAAVIDTEAAMRSPHQAGHHAAATAVTQLRECSLAIVSSERTRRGEDNTLAHGERVMSALTIAVRELLPHVEVVIAKGGITSADVARIGLGATSARVLGQVAPGVSVWRLIALDDRELTYIVVPGNVGGPDTLIDVLTSLGLAHS